MINNVKTEMTDVFDLIIKLEAMKKLIVLFFVIISFFSISGTSSMPEETAKISDLPDQDSAYLKKIELQFDERINRIKRIQASYQLSKSH